MRIIWSWFLIFLFLVPASLLAQAPSASTKTPARVYGRLQFMPPAGWQAFERADLLILVPAGLTVDTTPVSITLFPPAPRHRQSLSRWMQTVLQPIRSGYRVLQTEAPTASQSTKGAASLIMTELLGEPSGSGVIYQLYCAISTGPSGQLIMYSASNPHDFARGARTVNALIESVSVRKDVPSRLTQPPARLKKWERPALRKIFV